MREFCSILLKEKQPFLRKTARKTRLRLQQTLRTTLQKKKQFQIQHQKLISRQCPAINRLYSFLRESKVVTNADENLFIQYVTHAYFSPLYLNGKKVNIRYTIAQLKAYYDEGWLKAVCENINVTEKYITQRPPSDNFRKAFPSLTFKK